MKQIHFVKYLLVAFFTLALAMPTWAADVTLASWTFESGTAGTDYPSNKTNFSATAGTCTGSTFYLNGTGSTWNTTKGWAFTAVTDVQITIKAAAAIAKGTVLTFSVTTYYNKASNAPMTGFTLTCKEGSGSFATTGLSATSWSLSTSSAEKTVTYTTQNAIAKDGTICLKLTQTGKAGSGQGFMGPISVTMPATSSTKTLSKIELSGQTTSFTQNGTWSFGGTVTATYSDATTANVTSSTTFSGYNTANTGTQTVTASYTEGGVTKTATYQITVNAAAAAERTVTWYVNGAEYTTGTPTTKVNDGSKVSNLPDAPSAPSGCTGKVFVGWTDHKITTETDSKPSPLFKTAGDAPTVNGDVSYYAVFADQN